MNQLVTVIITTYQRSLRIVDRAIKSILTQTYSNLELIVVDDSPKEYEERSLIKQYIETIDDPRIRLIQHDKNQGACSARNTGIQNSNGKYIAFLDDDDSWCPDKLEKQMVKMKSGDYGLVYCRQHVVNEVNHSSYDPLKEYFEGKVFDKLILTNFIGSTSFALIKRECFDAVGMFDVRMPASQDLEMWLRIAQKYKVGFVDEPLVDYYIHEGESITGNYSKKLTAIEMLLEKYKTYFDEHPYERSIRYLKAAPYYAVCNKYKQALKYYCGGVISAPSNFYNNIEYFAKLIRAIVRKTV